MIERLIENPSQTGDYSPGAEHTPKTVSGNCSLAPSKSSSALSAKLRRHGVKIVTALKSLTNSSSERSAIVQQFSSSDGHGRKSAFALGIHKMSNAIFCPPLEPTVVRRPSPKSRPLLKETFKGVGTPPVFASGSNAVHITTSDASSGKTGTSNAHSTKRMPSSAGKTSLDSMFKNRDPNTVGREPKRLPNHSSQRVHRSPQPNCRGTPPSSPNGDLDSIQEIPLSYYPPGIFTAERAAAAKIYLETHFNELLATRPSGRQMRQQILETDLFNRARERGMPLSTAELQAERAQFCRCESEYLREMRAMKAKTLRMLDAQSTGDCCVRDYEAVKVLGKGSFGVVRLVREYRKGRLYAMKVIKKSKMLKSSQEGHLRAERDILVASEGSRW